VAQQPEVRAVEEAINPYLEVARDLDDPAGAREFFQRAALPVVHHLASPDAPEADDEASRHALLYPVKPGCGAAVARLLARQDELALANPENAVVRSTVFQREDIVMRLIDVVGPLDRRPAVAAGVGGPRAAAVLGRLARLDAYGGLADEAGLRRFLTDCAMQPITDRRAPGD
jgi:SchA/CurD like domain